MTDARRVIIGYLHPGWVTHRFLDSLLSILSTHQGSVRVAAQSGPNVSEARNEVGRIALDHEADLLFVDTDMEATGEHLSGLREHLFRNPDIGIVGALSRGLHPGSGQLFNTPIVRDVSGYRKISQNPQGLVNVAGVGMGFTLIRREVLEDLYHGKNLHRPLWPFAETTIRIGSKVLGRGEDLTFCERAYEAGWKTYVDCDTVVGHEKAMVI